MEHLKYTEILQLNKELEGTVTSKPYKVSILSNVTVNSFKEILQYSSRINGVEPDIELGNFDNIVQDSATMGERNMVVVCYDLLSMLDDLGIFFEDIDDQAYNALLQKVYAEIDMVLSNLAHVPAVVFNSFSSAYFVQNYSGQSRAEQFAGALNKYLESRQAPNLSIIRIDKIFGQLGIKQAIDFRFYQSSKAPYTVAFWKEYAGALLPIMLRNNGKLRKALIFDCDNTLWKGIIGEDGIDGIAMSAEGPGRYYKEVQQLAAYLSKRGVIIGLCSKNNAQDVDEVLAHNSMTLKNEHIVIKKVNWQDKATNLRAIAKELNIGIDSLVFIDDSPFEINLIKEQVPEILTVQVPAAIAEYPRTLLKTIYQHFNLNLSKEDARKTEMYKAQFEREESKHTFASLDDYLASLGITITIACNDTAQIPRVAQLTQKTNQFNLTTQRYTEGQIGDFMQAEGAHIFTIFVQDKFGDSGLTGIAIVKPEEGKDGIAVIDSLLMSCRIIGRNIEYVFLNHIIAALKKSGYHTVKAFYIPTAKNEQVRPFYEQRGFALTATGPDGGKQYELSIDSFVPESYSYINVIVN